MINVEIVASYILNRYQKEKGHPMDEMKLHKLLYLCQRESFIQIGEPMFTEPFEAWTYGPVVVSIREKYKSGQLTVTVSDDEIAPYLNVINYVFSNYASKNSWSLSNLTHSESSWLKARNGLKPEDHSSNILNIEDIKNDAERIKIRRIYFNEIVPRL